MLLDWLPSVTLKEFAVPARKAATVGKLNVPVPCRKLLLRNCRYSPPSLSECRPQQPAQSVRHDKGRIAAARRVGRRTAEVQTAAGNVDLRQADRLANAVEDAEVGRVELRIRRGAGGPAIEAEARFVDRCGPKVCVSFRVKICRSDVGDVAEAWDRVTRPAGLAGLRVLNGVEAMQPVSFTQIVADVHRPLIDVNRRARRADETRRAG